MCDFYDLIGVTTSSHVSQSFSTETAIENNASRRLLHQCWTLLAPHGIVLGGNHLYCSIERLHHHLECGWWPGSVRVVGLDTLGLLSNWSISNCSLAKSTYRYFTGGIKMVVYSLCIHYFCVLWMGRGGKRFLPPGVLVRLLSSQLFEGIQAITTRVSLSAIRNSLANMKFVLVSSIPVNGVDQQLRFKRLPMPAQARVKHNSWRTSLSFQAPPRSDSILSSSQCSVGEGSAETPLQLPALSGLTRYTNISWESLIVVPEPTLSKDRWSLQDVGQLG